MTKRMINRCRCDSDNSRRDNMYSLPMTTMRELSVFAVIFIAGLVVSARAQQETCTENSVCAFYTQGAVCVDEKCQCPENTLLSGDGSKCLSVITGYGSACEDDIQCSTALRSGGSCENGVCQCLDGYHYLKGQCWKNVPLHGACLVEEQCYAGYDFVGLTCENGLCVCRPEYYERAEACRRKVPNGEVCLVDDDCSCDNGQCKTLKCQCPDGTSPKTEESFVTAGESVPELGGDCGGKTCSVLNSICVDGRECGCPPGRVGSANCRTCNKVAIKIEASCTDNGQCGSFGAHAFCSASGTKKVCLCMEGYHYDPDALLCRQSKLIGEDCDVDNDCVAMTGGNVQCTSGKCTCTSGNHEANGGKSCRADGLVVGDSCVDNLDCMLADSYCDSTSHSCQCSENYFEKDEKCVGGIGSSCSDDSKCSNVEHASCLEETCQCQEGVSSGDLSKCLATVGPNGKCEETVQCDPALGELRECNGGVCLCQDGAQYILNRCYAIIKLDEKCKARAECVYPGSNPDAFMCQNGVCKCRYGYQRNGDDCV